VDDFGRGQFLKENCRHRGRYNISLRSGTGSSGDQALDTRQSAFSLLLGSLAHDRRLRSNPYDPQRPSVRECGGCEGRSAAPLHSSSVHGDELNFRLSTLTSGLPAKLQHIPTVPQCKVVVFPNAGHFPHLVAPDRFADEVRAIARKAVLTEAHHGNVRRGPYFDFVSFRLNFLPHFAN
jgi:pimeloyl-ACP methyl ester carboxylesterase